MKSTMNTIINDRYQKTFERLKNENRPAFCPFAVMGYPNEKEFMERIALYLEFQPDVLELGIPFSDPVADGPVIQAADLMALESGITPRKCISLVKKIRKLTAIPIGILVYANNILQYGIDEFYCDLAAAGADSVLIADVPLEEIGPFVHAARKYNLHQIFIVSENTSNSRLEKLEKYGSGFFYVVSSLGVTGEKKEVNPKLGVLIKRLQKNTKLPLMVGFGISTPEQVVSLKKTGVEGLIVGSALVKTPTNQLSSFLHALKNAYL